MKTVPKEWHEMNELHFEQAFPDIGGPEWPFSRVYNERPLFVEFALCWVEADGMYAQWQKYCNLREKDVRHTDSSHPTTDIHGRNPSADKRCAEELNATKPKPY